MRVIGTVEVGGVEYTSVWASLSSIQDDPDGKNPGKALGVRSGEGKIEAVNALYGCRRDCWSIRTT